MNIIVSIYNNKTLNSVSNIIDTAILNVPYLSLNYDEEFDLQSAIKTCKEKKIKVHLSIDKLFLENEILQAKDFIFNHKEYSFIISDLGLVRYCAQLKILDNIIYDNSTVICNSLDLEEYSDLGFEAVSISNEITINDLLSFSDIKNQSIFYQIFGYKKMFVSRRKLVGCYSSQNKILLARKNLFIKEEKRKDVMPIVENENGFLVYRSYMISLHQYLKELSFIKYGFIDSFNIDNESLSKIIYLFKLGVSGQLSKQELSNRIDELNLNIREGFESFDSVHTKEKIVDEKN